MDLPGRPTWSTRIDVGRVAGVLVFALFAAANLIALDHRLTGVAGVHLVPIVETTLTALINALIVLAYLRRGRATASDRKIWVWAIALLVTLGPLILPLTASGQRTTGPVAVTAIATLLAGLVGMVWALSALGPNLSVVPQARRMVSDGPYRWMRHPLYAAELFAATGMTMASNGPWPWVVLGCMAVLQPTRALREERLLVATLPLYASYQCSTPMLVPLTHRVARRRAGASVTNADKSMARRAAALP